MEINQASGDQSVWYRNGTHYDIKKGIDIDRDVHCEITMGSDVTISNNVAMCTYHSITMHNDIAMNLF